MSEESINSALDTAIEALDALSMELLQDAHNYGIVEHQLRVLSGMKTVKELVAKQFQKWEVGYPGEMIGVYTAPSKEMAIQACKDETVSNVFVSDTVGIDKFNMIAVKVS